MIGDVVVVPFPFADLSDVKRRPAVIVASADRGDVILCQVTSRPYASERAIRLEPSQISGDGLPMVSFARPDKLFTASPTLVLRTVGTLEPEVVSEIRRASGSLFAD